MNGSAGAFFLGGNTPGSPGGRTPAGGALEDVFWALSAASRSMGTELFLRGCA